MIHNSSEIVTLTDPQTAQLEEVKKRLLNFEAEISIAQKHIKVLKSDTETVVRERVYQEQLLSEATEATKKAQVILEGWHQEISQATETLEKCRLETKLINEANVSKASELNERERDLGLNEGMHAARVEDFTSKSAELLKDKLFVDTAKEAFLKALETVK